MSPMRILWTAVLATAVGGCPGETDEHDDTSPDGYAGHCEYRPTVLSDLDTVGLVGISARELLSRAEGTYTGELSWIANLASHANSGTTTSIRIDLSYAAGEIRDVEAVLLQPCGHLGPCPCEDRLEVDVNVRIVSTDGALDEEMVAALQYVPTDGYFTSELPHLYHRFDPDGSAGGLATSDIQLPEDATLREVFLAADFDDGTVTGGLNVEVDMRGGIGAGPIASFSATTVSTD